MFLLFVLSSDDYVTSKTTCITQSDDSTYEEAIKPILLTEKCFRIIRNFIQKLVADAEGRYLRW